MSAGINVAFLANEVQRDPRSSQIMQDVYALGCRIRSAVEAFDIFDSAKGLGNESSETVRRNCPGIQEAMVVIRTFTEFQFPT
eukprot:8086325-Pyramimonas_sp.AAC.1